MEPSTSVQNGKAIRQIQKNEKKRRLRNQRKGLLLQLARLDGNDKRKDNLLKQQVGGYDKRKDRLLRHLKKVGVHSEYQLLKALAKLGIKHYNGAPIPESYISRKALLRQIQKKAKTKRWKKERKRLLLQLAQLDGNDKQKDNLLKQQVGGNDQQKDNLLKQQVGGNDQQKDNLLKQQVGGNDQQKDNLLKQLKKYGVRSEHHLLKALARLGIKHYNGAPIPESYIPAKRIFCPQHHIKTTIPQSHKPRKQHLVFSNIDAESFSGNVLGHDSRPPLSLPNIQTSCITDSADQSIQACPYAGSSMPESSKIPAATISSSDIVCMISDDSGDEHRGGNVPKDKKFDLTSSNTCLKLNSFLRNDLVNVKASSHQVGDQAVRVELSKKCREDQKMNRETTFSSDVELICKEEKNQDWKYIWYPRNNEVATKKESSEVVDVDEDSKDVRFTQKEYSNMLDVDKYSDSDVRLVLGERQFSATSNGIWSCRVVNCWAVFSSKENLTEHLKGNKHSPCNPKVGLLDGHFLSQPFLFMCSSCGEISKSSLSCQKHIIRAGHLPILPPLKIVAFACPHCLSFFSDQRTTRDHMARLKHHNVALRFKDDEPGRATAIAIPHRFAKELIKRCAIETSTVRCLDCNTDVSSNSQWSFHQQQHAESHTCVAYSPHTVANMVASLLCDKECSRCTQVLFLSPGMEGVHQCSDHMTGVAVGLKVSSFAEFVRRCSIASPFLRSCGDRDSDCEI